VFDEIRYELNDTKIDRNRNVGMISTIKKYVLCSHDSYKEIANRIKNESYKAGFFLTNDITNYNRISDDGYFNFCMPLMLLDFCKDYIYIW